MKKFNKILSLALVLIMTFSAVAILIPPIEAGAVYTSDIDESKISTDKIKEIAYDAQSKSYEPAEEMLEAEKALGYLDSVKMQNTEKGIDNTIYVNRYTGVVYYVNNVTGQILTSNPYQVGSVSGSAARYELMSQIVVDWFYTKTSAEGAKALNSYEDAALRAQITTESIVGGIRVNYTIGDTTTKYLLPMQITAEMLTSPKE